MPASAHPAPAGATIYYWSSGLLTLAPTLVVERPSSPLGATLRIALAEPYVIEVRGERIVTRASLLAPKSGRRRIVAVDSDIAVFYLPMDAPEYPGLRAALRGGSLLNLDVNRFAALLPEIREAFAGALPCARVLALARAAAQAVTGTAAPRREPDARVLKARRLLDETPLSEVSLRSLGERLHLSVSRLRELFRQETGTSIGQYARWLAVWRAVTLWQQGRTLTELAQEAGFFDLAHMSRAFVEVFGMNPLTAIDPRYVKLIRCG